MTSKRDVRVRRAYDEPTGEMAPGCWSTGSGPGD